MGGLASRSHCPPTLAEITFVLAKVTADCGTGAAAHYFGGYHFYLVGETATHGAETLIAVSIASLTGGIVLTPFLYLVADYLSHQTWHPLSPQLIHHDVKLKPKMLMWSLLFFSLGLLAELTLLEQMKPFALLIILLPTIFLAYRYGWQGGVLASSLNCILLATARQFSGSFSSDQELLIFMSSQAFVGLDWVSPLAASISSLYYCKK